jgi:hypothetical protein
MAIHTHADTHSHGYIEPNSGQGHQHTFAVAGGAGGGGPVFGGGSSGGTFTINFATTGITISNATGFLGNAGGQGTAPQAMNNVPPGGVSNTIIKR